MSRPTAPERPRAVSEERRKHLDLAQSRMQQRHRRIVGELAESPSPKRPQRSSWWKRLVSQFGWRAYALPLLAIVTVLALFTTNTGSVRSAITGGPAPQAMAPPTAAPSGRLKVDTGGVVNNEAIASDALPAGAPYPQQGNASFHVIAGASAVFGSGPLHTFAIEAENGMSVTAAQEAGFASVVMATLTNAQSWQGHNVSLQRLNTDSKADFRVTLTSSMTVRTLCGYDIQIETSCYAPDQDSRVVLNIARWVRGDNAYFMQLDSYHTYMVDHEVGHALGHVHAHQCLSDGLAPVMMQQTIGLKTASGQACQRNPWPYPTGATDAPGVEQAGTSSDQQFIKLNT